MLRRCLALASLLVVCITDMAPHRHGDALFELFGGATEIEVFHCDSPARNVPHLHSARSREIDPCLACLRQHLQATASVVTPGNPRILERLLTVSARVAYARSIRLRKSSRGPPTLAS